MNHYAVFLNKVALARFASIVKGQDIHLERVEETIRFPTFAKPHRA